MKEIQESDRRNDFHGGNKYEICMKRKVDRIYDEMKFRPTCIFRHILASLSSFWKSVKKMAFDLMCLYFAL